MKKIDFKAWDTKRKMFTNFMIVDNMFEFMDKVTGVWIRDDEQKRFKLLQYTGLKDKNGVTIYEGDVIHHRSIIPQWDKDLINEIQAVVLTGKGMTRVEGWNENGYIGEEIHRVHYACLLLSPESFEIIGNVHDNPKLMEMKK